MRNIDYIVVFLLIISLLALDLHFSSSYREYSMYNSNWNGTSFFINNAQDSGAEIITDYQFLEESYNSTLILIEPDGIYSPDELRSLRNFKNNGNIIFISDETGSSEQLLKIFGTELSVEKGNLSSVDMEYQNPRFIICYPFGEDPLINRIDTIALNKPSAASGGTTLIETSFMSWIDENGNEKADSYESIGKRSVLVQSENVYLLSDSGIFQNAIYRDENLKDNNNLISNLLHSSENTYIDGRNSGIVSENSISGILSNIRQNEMIKAATIIIIILLLLLIYRGRI